MSDRRPRRHVSFAPYRAMAPVVALALGLAACGGGPDETSAEPVSEDPEPQDEVPDEAPEDGPVDGGDDAADAGDDPDEADEPTVPAVDPASVDANELGQVPVLMYHQLREDGGSIYDMSPEEFRTDLVELFDNGYRPVTTSALVNREFDVPAGTTPVVLTFDDSVRNQAFLDDEGQLHPDSSMGILIDVAADYDDVEPVASLYLITSSLFGGTADGPDIVRALHEAGMELGNHTTTHPNLGRLGAAEVQDELSTAISMIQDIVPSAEVSTLSLPLGVFPEDRGLATSGSGADGDYEHDAVLLVGSNPAPSPWHVDFAPQALPRILTLRDPGELQGSAWWFEQFEVGQTHQRYISDGNPATISFPADRADQLDPAFADRANPY
jgi:peptidoglycan/xylan/chitin deacetylase (PgdA/CDA1 family)